MAATQKAPSVVAQQACQCQALAREACLTRETMPRPPTHKVAQGYSVIPIPMQTHKPEAYSAAELRSPTHNKPIQRAATRRVPLEPEAVYLQTLKPPAPAIPKAPSEQDQTRNLIYSEAIRQQQLHRVQGQASLDNSNLIAPQTLILKPQVCLIVQTPNKLLVALLDSEALVLMQTPNKLTRRRKHLWEEGTLRAPSALAEASLEVPTMPRALLLASAASGKELSSQHQRSIAEAIHQLLLRDLDILRVLLEPVVQYLEIITTTIMQIKLLDRHYLEEPLLFRIRTRRPAPPYSEITIKAQAPACSAATRTKELPPQHSATATNNNKIPVDPCSIHKPIKAKADLFSEIIRTNNNQIKILASANSHKSIKTKDNLEIIRTPILALCLEGNRARAQDLVHLAQTHPIRIQDSAASERMPRAAVLVKVKDLMYQLFRAVRITNKQVHNRIRTCFRESPAAVAYIITII